MRSLLGPSPDPIEAPIADLPRSNIRNPAAFQDILKRKRYSSEATGFIEHFCGICAGNPDFAALRLQRTECRMS